MSNAKTYPMVDKTIEDAFNVALSLGLSNATEFEQRQFKAMLRGIAMFTVDAVRSEVNDLMHHSGQRYNASNFD